MVKMFGCKKRATSLSHRCYSWRDSCELCEHVKHIFTITGGRMIPSRVFARLTSCA